MDQHATKSFNTQSRHTFCRNYDNGVIASRWSLFETDEDTVVKFLGHSVIYYRISWPKVNVTILPWCFIKAELTIGECMTDVPQREEK